MLWIIFSNCFITYTFPIRQQFTSLSQHLIIDLSPAITFCLSPGTEGDVTNPRPGREKSCEAKREVIELKRCHEFSGNALMFSIWKPTFTFGTYENNNETCISHLVAHRHNHFYQPTRNCVIQEETKKSSNKHVGGQQYVQHLVDLFNSWTQTRQLHTWR